MMLFTAQIVLFLFYLFFTTISYVKKPKKLLQILNTLYLFVKTPSHQ